LYKRSYMFRSIWTETCRSVYTNVLIVNFNIFMLKKCAFVGQKKNFDIYRNARYYNNKNLFKTLCAMLRWGFVPYLATSLIFVENFFTLS
jgi:hypothetical protein